LFQRLRYIAYTNYIKTVTNLIKDRQVIDRRYYRLGIGTAIQLMIFMVRIIDAVIIQKILALFDKKHPLSAQMKTILPPMRAPPQQDFDLGT
jgi:hypothetical protein